VKVGKKAVVRAALLGAVSVPVLPVLAQEIDAVRMNFGVSQRFEFGDNLALDDPSQGESSIATTTLSFGLVTETERQQLDFGLSGALQIQNTPDTDGTETGFANPRADLSYNLNGGDSQFSVDGLYFESDIDTLSLSDFVNRDGIVVLPEDFANLQGTGTRSSYSLDLRLQSGLEAPLGFDLSVGTSGVDYTNTNDPDLFNYNRAYAGARALFRPTEVLTGSVGLRYSTYDASNQEQTFRTQTGGDVGLQYDISSRAVIEAALGVTETKTEELGNPDETTSSPVGSIGYSLDMPDGEITLSLDARVDENGDERTNLVFGRSRNLPDGELSYTLGLTDPASSDIEPIGSLMWERNLPAAQISAQLSRAVTTTNQDETDLTTLVVLNYEQSINDVSGFGLTASYGQTDGTGPADSTTRASISATYRYALTRDWGLDTGVSYRTLDEDGGTASSPSVFLTIGRRFNFGP
jgi:hypothetical protein